MKLFFLMITLTASFSSFAIDPIDVCYDYVRFDSNRLDCMDIVRSGDISEHAAEVCVNASFDDGKNDCLAAALNKVYTFNELNSCDRQSWDDDRTRCMRRKGQSIRRQTRTVVTEVQYDHNEYMTCYERPKTRLVEYTDHRQARRGRNRVLGGLAAIIGGQIVGGDVGDAISIVGAGFAIYGAVEVADSQEIIYQDNGYDCRSYYQADRRVYTRTIERQTCTTRRYYSNRWGSTHEYFETTCSNKKFMTFERSADVWYAN